jgi:hypothetical protein
MKVYLLLECVHYTVFPFAIVPLEAKLPMPSKSDQSVRVRNVPFDTGQSAFQEVANTLCSIKKKSSSSLSLFSVPPTSLAIDGDEKIGTITFPTKHIKENALLQSGPNWSFDESFNGLTVLQTPENADVEYV